MFSTIPITRHAHALEHLRAAQGVAHGDFLRGGDDDGGADLTDWASDSCASPVPGGRSTRK